MIYKHNGSIITDIAGKWLSHTETPPQPTLEEITIGTQTWATTKVNSDIMMLKVNPEDTYIDLVSASNPTNNYYSIRLIKDT